MFFLKKKKKKILQAQKLIDIKSIHCKGDIQSYISYEKKYIAKNSKLLIMGFILLTLQKNNFLKIKN